MTTQEEFIGFNHEEQVARIELLGRAALDEFGIIPTAIRPLVHAENSTYWVNSELGAFCLRVSRPGYQSLPNLSSEIAWLSALAQAGHHVPEPYQSRIVTASVPEVPEPRYCVAFRWQEGEFRHSGFSPSDARLLGQAIGRLHQFTSEWQLPDGFERQEQHGWVTRPNPFVSASPILSEEDRDLLHGEWNDAAAMVLGLERSPDRYGLIHADLHAGNLLFKDDRLNLIDFDDASFAFLVYDFAAALAYEGEKPSYEAVRDACLDGYSSVRTLPPDTEALLNPFLRLRLMNICGWLVTRNDNPGLQAWGRDWAPKLCNQIRKWA